MVDGETSPPLLLSEADLIALMEKHGIGQYGQRGLSLLGELCSQLLSLPGTSSVPPSEQGILCESLQIRIYLNIQNRGIVETCGQIPGVLRRLQSVPNTEGDVQFRVGGMFAPCWPQCQQNVRPVLLLAISSVPLSL